MVDNIYRSSETDFESVQKHLKALNLPIEGLKDQIHNFFLIKDNEYLIGSVGLEIYQDYGLLRSLGVRPNFRGKQIGSKLVNATITLAKRQNLDSIYLLTETASKFFEKLNFKEIERNKVPISIQNSVEYSTVCSDSATVMRINLKG